MCGRTACTLDPDVLPKACQYKDRNGNKRQPKWKNNDSSQYFPSYNISPQSYTPVLVSCKSGPQSTKHEISDDERELQAMKWGLVPSWHRGDPGSFGYKMNNARIESITEKKSFKGALEKGRRCVVLAEGFYEWQEVKGGGQKQPYFIYFKEKIKHDENNEEDEMKSDRPLLTMAGIFDVWQPSSEEEPLYSYSVITLEAKAPFRSIHHRVPAVLKDEEAVRQWLDGGEIKYEQALKLLSPDDCLDWHPVSKAVNNSRYKEPDCTKEINLSLAEKKAQRSKITNWFKKSPKKRETSSGSTEEPATKKEKLEQ